MAITSKFYTGPVDGQQWGEGQLGIGERFWVADEDAAKVTVVSGTTIRFAAGKVGGGGVFDDITAAEEFEIPTPGSNGTVYWTAIARRTWQTTNATTLLAVQGSSSRSIAASLNSDPGTIDDQPLALIAVTKSGATVTAAVEADLRAVGTGGNYEAYDNLTRTYMNEPGYRVRIGNTEWTRLANGTWESHLTASGAGSLNAHWDSGDLEWAIDGKSRYIRINARRAFTGGTSNNILIGTVPSAVRPSRMEYGSAAFTNGGGYTSMTVAVATDGSVTLYNQYTQGDVREGNWLRCSISWIES